MKIKYGDGTLCPHVRNMQMMYRSTIPTRLVVYISHSSNYNCIILILYCYYYGESYIIYYIKNRYTLWSFNTVDKSVLYTKKYIVLSPNIYLNFYLLYCYLSITK